MDLKVYKSFYGGTETPNDYKAYIKKLADDGYDGAEQTIGCYNDQEREEILVMMKDHGLEYMPKIYTVGKTPEEHLQSLRENLDACVKWNVQKVNCQAARDFWEEDVSVKFYEDAMKMDSEYDFSVIYETHRFRAMNSPWATYRICKRLPELKITADFSHYLVLSESDCSEFTEWIDYCCTRAWHVHGRVSYEEGPMVPDPRAPEYKKYVDIFEGWWGKIIEAQYKRGETLFTFDPEYGIPPYEWRIPYTQQRLVDGWAVANWTMARFREQFASTLERLQKEASS